MNGNVAAIQRGVTDVKHSLIPSNETPARPPVHYPPEVHEAQMLEMVYGQIAVLGLDLSGLTVVVGATTGYQAAIATAAALAGASRVAAFVGKPKKESDLSAVAGATMAFASYARVSERVEVVDRIDSRGWQSVDLLVNCHQVEPISRALVELLPPHAIIALMAEPWELRPGTVDFEACDDAGIKVAALNLEHPAVLLLPELARLCCILLDDAGVLRRGARLAVLCDTPLARFIERALRMAGAAVSIFPHPLLLADGAWDAIVVAMRPSGKPAMDINSLGRIFDGARHALLVQFSGDVDRAAASYFGLKVWPPKRPGRGQLGLPLEVLGPFPTIRRLAGGLKAAEAVFRGADLGRGSIGYIAGGSD